MKYLTKQMQTTLEKQIMNRSRDIDVAIYNAIDGSMSYDFVLDCLMFYMNKDGGFGNGLHIDNYNTNSSVYQVYEAFRILDMIDLDSHCSSELFNTIINKACNFLYNRMSLFNGRWKAVIESNNSFAHSAEFTYHDATLEQWEFHPTMALVGYTLLFCKPTMVYYKKALKMVDLGLQYFYNKANLSKYDYISFSTFLNCIKKIDILKEDQLKIEKKLFDFAVENISMNFDDYNAISPIIACTGIEYNEELERKLNLHLDYLIDSIKPHGMWEANHSWNNIIYPEEDSAKLKWLGAISVNNYFILKKFGRLE